MMLSQYKIFKCYIALAHIIINITFIHASFLYIIFKTVHTIDFERTIFFKNNIVANKYDNNYKSLKSSLQISLDNVVHLWNDIIISTKLSYRKRNISTQWSLLTVDITMHNISRSYSSNDCYIYNARISNILFVFLW